MDNTGLSQAEKRGGEQEVWGRGGGRREGGSSSWKDEVQTVKSTFCSVKYCTQKRHLLCSEIGCNIQRHKAWLGNRMQNESDVRGSGH